uniref:Uncharacterized protein n=1 Tax=Timema bartmani TaxID=61472 RepID=A0A7R9I8I9_9NEOP|nr:unnamed protein product [Timema bartmani]
MDGKGGQGRGKAMTQFQKPIRERGGGEGGLDPVDPPCIYQSTLQKCYVYIDWSCDHPANSSDRVFGNLEETCCPIVVRPMTEISTEKYTSTLKVRAMRLGLMIYPSSKARCPRATCVIFAVESCDAKSPLNSVHKSDLRLVTLRHH